MKTATKVKIKNLIIKLSKRVSKKDLAISILTYYHIHISDTKPMGSPISVSIISKELGLKIGEGTTIELNKLLTLAQMIGTYRYLEYLGKEFARITKNNLTVF